MSCSLLGWGVWIAQAVSCTGGPVCGALIGEQERSSCSINIRCRTSSAFEKKKLECMVSSNFGSHLQVEAGHSPNLKYSISDDAVVCMINL